jgi:hypothetical protein
MTPIGVDVALLALAPGELVIELGLVAGAGPQGCFAEQECCYEAARCEVRLNETLS